MTAENFPDKPARVNTGMRLLPDVIKIIDDAGVRMGGKSRAFVVELLVAQYGKALNKHTLIPAGLLPTDTRSKPPAAKPGPATKSKVKAKAKGK